MHATLRMRIQCLFAASLARHQLTDGAPRVYVDTGWHPPYSSLASPREAKTYSESSYNKPTLVGIPQGVWWPHGVSLTQEDHGYIGICLDVFLSFKHCSRCCLSLYTTELGGAQLSLNTVKLTSEHEALSLLARI